MTILLVGSSSALCNAFIQHVKVPIITLSRSPNSRAGHHVVDITSESAVAKLAQTLRKTQTRLQGIIHFAGTLTPEKRFSEINEKTFMDHIKVNAWAPLLIAKHFAEKLERKKFTLMIPPKMETHNSTTASSEGVSSLPFIINVSARTGSITDNHTGGWYSYRSSKAAQNQITKCLHHQLNTYQRNEQKKVVCVAYHPGTIQSPLSRDFLVGRKNLLQPEEAAQYLADFVHSLRKEDSGKFFDYQKKHTGKACSKPIKTYF